MVMCTDASGEVTAQGIELFLEVHNVEDVRHWIDALKGDPQSQNSVGWMLSFGRREQGGSRPSGHPGK
jgi:hypothetical protein